MNNNEAHLKLDALGREHSIDILNTVYQNEWITASEVAKKLGLHIATAVKYLSKMQEAGLLDRRARKTRTRDAYEYILRDPRIHIEINLANVSNQDSEPGQKNFLISMLAALFIKAEKMQGETIIKRFFDEASIKNEEKSILKRAIDANDFKNTGTLNSLQYESITSSMMELINLLEDEMGQINAGNIVEYSILEVIKASDIDRGRASQYIKHLPSRYHLK